MNALEAIVEQHALLELDAALENGVCHGNGVAKLRRLLAEIVEH